MKKKEIDENIEEPQISYDEIVREIGNRRAKQVATANANESVKPKQNNKISKNAVSAPINSKNSNAVNSGSSVKPSVKPRATSKTSGNGIKASASGTKSAVNGKTGAKQAQASANSAKKTAVSNAKTSANGAKAKHTEAITQPNGKKIRYFDSADTAQQLQSRGGRRGAVKRKVDDEQELGAEYNVERNPYNLKVMFLGGVGEIGKNMTVLEYGDDIMVIDAGLSFPTEQMPGIDVVVPDISYLVENKDRVRGIVLTHGHEDHIGGLPYTLNEIHCPIYGSKLTLALVQNKLREHPKVKAKYEVVNPHDTIELGCFKVEFLHVNHSIVGAYAVSITTPVGIVFHTGDFKIDLQPVDGQTTDLKRMEEIGKQGVLLLMCESTNVEKAGHSMSESKVGESLNAIFAENVGKRIFIATFASNVHRIQQITNLAEKYGRRVAFSGRSMIKNMEVAARLNELHYNTENVIDIDRIANYPDGELCIITTGSQGEPMSALTRIANGEFNKVEVTENDCFILSSSPIPGNERAVNNTINALFKKGADVIYEYLMPVHVSGHGYYDEIKQVHQLLKPKYFIPVHGEYKHLKHHKDLALSLGMYESNVKIADIGDCFEINKDLFKESGKVKSGSRLIDGLGVGEVDSSVLKDRINLSEEGLCVTVVAIDKKKGVIKNGPEIITRGLIYSSEASSLVEEARQFVRETILKSDIKNIDVQVLKQNIRKALSGFFNKKTRRNPTVLTVVFDIK